MDLLIKSFNRPYYLDRCIQSIYLNIHDNNFNIIVLDDGTPKKYLDKLLEKFPSITILKSDLYLVLNSFYEFWITFALNIKIILCAN